MPNKLKVALGRTLLLTAYIMFGSWLFHFIEKTPITYSEMSAKMLDDLYRKCNISVCLNHSQFMNFAKQAYEAVKVGRKVDWSFLNASSYVFSIVTTIGYGHMTPQTELGQGLTVPYALVGLPVCMFALKAIGEAIVNGIRSLIIKIEKCLLHRARVHRARVKTFIGTCLLMAMFILLGTVMEVVAEDWSFVEGIYVWFVTFATIGFGDYIPLQGLEQNAEYRDKGIWVVIFGLAFFTLAGLCVVSAVLTSLVDAAEELRDKSFLGGRIKRNKVLRTAKYTFDNGDKCKQPRRNAFVLGGRIWPKNPRHRPRARSRSF